MRRVVRCTLFRRSRALVPLTAALSQSGCLIPSPPELSDPEATRPHIHFRTVTPPIGTPIRLVRVDDNDPRTQAIKDVSFTIPFQSEDIGEALSARLHVNAPGQTPRLKTQSGRIPPGQFSEERFVTLQWDPSELGIGCYRFRVTLAHEGSFGDMGLIPPELESDADRVSWLAYVESEDSPGSVVFDDCPRLVDLN